MGMNFGQTVIFLSEGNSLKKMRLHFDGDINVPNKVRKLGVFTFRAFHMEILQAKCDSYYKLLSSNWIKLFIYRVGGVVDFL